VERTGGVISSRYSRYESTCQAHGRQMMEQQERVSPGFHFLPAYTTTAESLYWLLRSSVQKQALGDGQSSSSPACKHRKVGVQSDVVTSILMLERRYSHLMEKLLLWVVFSSLSSS
jgi:hypothetical protein